MSSDPLGSSLIELCRQRNLTFVSAESCTGGLITATLTDIPGSSEVVWGGFVTYANEAKRDSLSVPEALIIDKGAVSREVAVAMASGALQKSGASLSVAVSGIAGPGGGSPEKPVGTVWIACDSVKGVKASKLFLFKGDRASIRLQTVEQALLLCEKIILNDSSLDSHKS